MNSLQNTHPLIYLNYDLDCKLKFAGEQISSLQEKINRFEHLKEIHIAYGTSKKVTRKYIKDLKQTLNGLLKKAETLQKVKTAYEKLCLEKKIFSPMSAEDLKSLTKKIQTLPASQFTIYNFSSTFHPPLVLCHPNERSFQIGLLDRILGSGSFGVIYRTTLFEGENRTQIAIKLSIDEEKEALETIGNELNILKHLHEDSESLQGIQPLPITTASTGTFLFEREVIGYSMDLFECDYSNFIQRIIQSTPQPLTGPSVLQMVNNGPTSLFNIFTHFVKLASAVEHLQKKGIFHSDIKCENVLLKGRNIKLCDFGSAKSMTLGQNPNPNACPYSNSPFSDLVELSLKNCNDPVERQEAFKIAFHIDQYQLGDMFYRIFSWFSSGYISTSIPYPLEELGTVESRLYPKHFIPGFYAPKKTEATPKEFPKVVQFSIDSENLIKQMVAVDKNKRPPIKQVIELFKLVLRNGFQNGRSI